MDGTSCSKASTYSSFTSFDYQNVIIYINGDEANDLTSTLGTTLSALVTVAQAKTSAEFNQVLKVSGIDKAFTSINLLAATSSPAPVIDTSSKLTTTSDSTSVTVTGFKLSSGDGIFFGIATTDTSIVPTQNQIRAKLDGTGSAASGFNVLYSSTGGTSVKMVFSNLEPETAYLIYYYATNNDRTQYAKVTDVAYVTKTTRSAAAAVSASRVEVSFIAVLIMSITALLL